MASWCPAPPVTSNERPLRHGGFCPVAAYALRHVFSKFDCFHFQCHLTEIKKQHPPRACGLYCSQDCHTLLIPSLYIACLLVSLFLSPHTYVRHLHFPCHCTEPSSFEYGNRGAISQQWFSQERFLSDGCFHYCCFFISVELLLFVQTQTKSHLCFPDSWCIYLHESPFPPFFVCVCVAYVFCFWHHQHCFECLHV